MTKPITTVCLATLLVVLLNAAWPTTTEAQLATGPQLDDLEAFVSRAVARGVAELSVPIGTATTLEAAMIRALGEDAIAGPGLVESDDPGATDTLGDLITPFSSAAITIQNLGDAPVRITLNDGKVREVPAHGSKAINIGTQNSATYLGLGSTEPVRFLWVIRNHSQ